MAAHTTPSPTAAAASVRFRARWTVGHATTAAITLTLSGYKSKGRHVVDLTWSGTTAASVDIYRDGQLLKTVADSGAYTDQTGNTGSATYGYQVCEAGTGICSDVESVSF